MNLIRKHIIIIASLFFCSGAIFNLNAQDKDSLSLETEDHFLSLSNLSAGDYARLVLPPLSYLMETANNSPKVGVLLATRDVEEGNLKTVKRNWMNSFYVFGTYQYGKYITNVNSTTSSISTGGGTTPVQTTTDPIQTKQAQDTYSSGAGFTLPLELFVNRNNTIKIQQKKIKQIDYQIIDAVNEQKMQIADVYSTAVQQLAVLKIQAELYTLANSQMKMGEVQYLNGDLKMTEYNALKAAQAAAIVNYESTRAALNKAILFLELMTGVNIIKK